ncbi:MAG TPA: ATP-binding protein [Candidatus Binataceae bacterium]|nr:ATP-binding protein [Candidatus Binataceae bacterium]
MAEESPSKKALVINAVGITLTYLAVGLLWVVTSEFALSEMPARTLVLNRVAFILASGGLLYVLASRWAGRIRRVNQDLEETAARAAALFDAAAWGILRVSPDGTIHNVNPKAIEMFGYTLEELIGQPVELLIPQRLRQGHLGHRANFFSAPQSRQMGVGAQLVGARKDGGEFPIEVSLNFLHTIKGDVVMAFITDVTERLKLEREARRGETLTALGAIAAGVAHELNNPLAVVSSRIELIMATAEPGLSAQTREDLEVVHRNARRASQIAAELLNSARQRPVERRPVNLNDLVEETLRNFREQMRRVGVSIAVALAPGLAPIKGDRIALEQVLINLLANASDAMAAGGGTLRIEGHALPDRPGFAQLSVSDTGCGIMPDALGHIFDVFYTTKATGTGLGLWLCRRIMLEHQGRIDVRSEVGCGTTFTITLPLAEVPDQVQINV